MNFRDLDNNELSSLPAGIFDKLPSLEGLKVFVFSLIEFISLTVLP